MKRKLLYGLVGAIILFFVGALIGLFMGMNIGGNYFPTFEFWGSVGYEATGMIGLIVGGVLGAISGFFLGKNMAHRKT